MALTPVAPGDLITADQFNALIATLVAHEARLTVLEQRAAQPAPSADPWWKHVLDDYAVAIQDNKADAGKLKEIAKEMVGRGVPATAIAGLLDDKGVTAVRTLEVIKTLPDPPPDAQTGLGGQLTQGVTGGLLGASALTQLYTAQLFKDIGAQPGGLFG
jgi:hypothetical protein